MRENYTIIPINSLQQQQQQQQKPEKATFERANTSDHVARATYLNREKSLLRLRRTIARRKPYNRSVIFLYVTYKHKLDVRWEQINTNDKHEFFVHARKYHQFALHWISSLSLSK